MEVKKDLYILGIESSCDETSVSIVKNGTEEISTVISSQIDIHKDFGGVVPEIASRHHVKNITMVLEECLKKAEMEIEDITIQPMFKPASNIAAFPITNEIGSFNKVWSIEDMKNAVKIVSGR